LLQTFAGVQSSWSPSQAVSLPIDFCGSSIELVSVTSCITPYSDLELKPVGTLEVKLVQAQGLTNKDIIGKSDPFAELFIRPLRNRTKTKKVIKNDLSPIWNEHFEFVVEDISTQHLTVKIYDDEGLQAAELLGCAQVQLNALEPGKVKDVWIKLVKDLDIQRDNKDRGKVHLELLYCPYGMDNGFTNPFTSNFTMTSLEKVLKSGDTGNGDLESKKKFVIVRGVLSVTVISAEDLPATDLLGKSDPFVVLTMKKTGMKNSTRVVNENLNPVWNQTFDFVVEDGLHDMLVVEVYDHDTFGKEYIGRCILTLTRVILEGEYKECFVLDGAKSGKLHLNLKWMAQPIYRDS
nr:synaptotagmin-5-like isoform X1 [Tanacetum cinerariifolium]